MRKKSFYAWSLVAALMMTACSSQDDETQSGETAKLEFSITFDGVKSEAGGGRAAQSTAIPKTSWDNINQLQFFLYDVAGNVCYSKIESPASGNTQFTYTDVPVGSSYTLVAVANTKSSADPISTYTGGAPMIWNDYNVRQKAITDFVIKHKDGTFPTYNNPSASGNKAYEVPSEIFMGSVAVPAITSGVTTTAPVLALKREVSLMRVRLRVNDTDAGVNNGSGAKGVDFGQDASVLVYTLPTEMTIEAAPAGGVSAVSDKKAVLVGATSFETADPAAADYNPNQIITSDFPYWKDIVVFPNNGGRVNDALINGDNDPSRYYFIVVSGLGDTGHILADNTELSAPTTVYWSGLVKKNFCPNIIREVNLTLKSGGTTTLPTEPTEEGGLEITVSSPAPWNDNIQVEDIIL